MRREVRLITKLVLAAGGWEHFLYQTLKEVCDELAPTVVDAGVAGDTLEEARIVVHMYEEKMRKENGEPDTETVQPAPVIETQAGPTGSAGPPSPDELQSQIVLPKPEPKPKPVPRKLHAKVPVDKDVGGSHGELPMPAGFNLVNRDTLIVTTQDGLELGRGSADGQVRGQGVTGQVTSSGIYRLAFKDVDLGAGVVHFDAALAPKPAPAPVPAPKPESESAQRPIIAKLVQGDGI